MTRRHWLIGPGLAAASVALALLINSCSTVSRTVFAPPDIPGATYVGNRACFECHTNYVRVFPASPHARLHIEGAEMPGQSGCESCHGPGSLHVQAGGGLGKFIVNPGQDPTVCFQCHLQTHAEFNLPHRHPVIEGKMNCVQCHDPHGMDIMKPARGLAMARLDETCAQCHREQTKPHAFEHEAMRDGCTACHTPHGSVNAKLLLARDNNLCLRCHAQRPDASGQIVIGQVPHSLFLQQGACYSAGCHTAVHGSNMDRRLFY